MEHMDIDRYVASCVVHLALNFPKMFCDWVPIIVCIHDWVSYWWTGVKTESARLSLTSCIFNVPLSMNAN